MNKAKENLIIAAAVAGAIGVGYLAITAVTQNSPVNNWPTSQCQDSFNNAASCSQNTPAPIASIPQPAQLFTI